jgi:hypothetical protein
MALPFQAAEGADIGASESLPQPVLLGAADNDKRNVFFS